MATTSPSIVQAGSPSELREILGPKRQAGQRIGFVPTMGALHEGHLSLARALTETCDVRVASIFVNPKQFNDPKDYEAYLIDLEKDKALLLREGVDVLYAPKPEVMYPKGFQTQVSVDKISLPFEGAHRPGHFTGVATVVAMLFLHVQPDVAIFGEKDFQQLRLIEQIVLDLGFPIAIQRGTLVRDSDGLALSSRNARLSEEGRRRALSISRGLFLAAEHFRKGELRSKQLEELASAVIRETPGTEIEYLNIARESDLAPLDRIEEPARLLTVVRVEGVRLLDNIALHPPVQMK